MDYGSGWIVVYVGLTLMLLKLWFGKHLLGIEIFTKIMYLDIGVTVSSSLAGILSDNHVGMTDSTVLSLRQVSVSTEGCFLICNKVFFLL